MNKYLDDRDSDFSEFSSVGSDKVQGYEATYMQILKGEGGKKIKPVKFEIHNRCKTHAQIVEETKMKHGLVDDFDISAT